MHSNEESSHISALFMLFLNNYTIFKALVFSQQSFQTEIFIIIISCKAWKHNLFRCLFFLYTHIISGKASILNIHGSNFTLHI